jgi:arylsulfatase A-like enzyme
MKPLWPVLLLLLGFAFHPWSAAGATAAPHPNIVLILCDDLGYGDVRANNPSGKIATPCFDRLAAEGMRFTDAHSSSAVCTPTRYNLLTGRYNWRTRLQNGVLNGLSAPLITSGHLTLAGLLRQHGYGTACIGKWHLGMDWAFKGRPNRGGKADGWGVDYTQRIASGPLACGFDHYFGIPASLDMPPFVFVEDDRVTTPPSTNKTWIRTGAAAADFEARNVLPALTARAIRYVSQQATNGKPFFLYLPLNSPHTPIVPDPQFQGKSGLGAYGDFVMQTDAAIGEMLAALDRGGLRSNTLVIATSDNGCSPAANFSELAAKGHDPSHPFRGAKADIFEGGHRVPFVARWPARVKAGTVSGRLICLGDVFATCAEILGVRVPENAAEDSVSFLPVLLGQEPAPSREALVHHSINGSFAIRQGQWKLALCPDSGGWSAPRPSRAEATNLPPVQLYDLAADPAEKTNVQASHPEIVERLRKLLTKYINEGRSTPGRPLTNDVPVRIPPA